MPGDRHGSRLLDQVSAVLGQLVRTHTWSPHHLRPHRPLVLHHQSCGQARRHLSAQSLVGLGSHRDMGSHQDTGSRLSLGHLCMDTRLGTGRHLGTGLRLGTGSCPSTGIHQGMGSPINMVSHLCMGNHPGIVSSIRMGHHMERHPRRTRQYMGNYPRHQQGYQMGCHTAVNTGMGKCRRSLGLRHHHLSSPCLLGLAGRGQAPALQPWLYRLTVTAACLRWARM